MHIIGYFSQKYQRFHREVAEVTEFYVTKDTNEPKYNVLYRKTPDGNITIHNPSQYLIDYLESQGVIIPKDALVKEEFHEPNTKTATEQNQNSNNIIQNITPNLNNINNNQQIQNKVNNNIEPINLVPNIGQLNNQQQMFWNSNLQ